MPFTRKDFGFGRIGDVIKGLKHRHKVDSLDSISEKDKLNTLCYVLDFSPEQLDALIADNSPVLRTVQGHAFETFFQILLARNGHTIEKRGGDTDIDQVLNGHTLQLKTPTRSGTRETEVQYKTHKTHGAKSEQESLEYYHGADSFADFLVGLITYTPLRIMILGRDELPTHPKDRKRILSPFTINWSLHSGLGAFNRLGIKKLDLEVMSSHTHPKTSLLPRTSKLTELSSEIIVDTIIQEENFRIWDMNMRGFAREHAFRFFLKDQRVVAYDVSHCSRPRADKADIALLRRVGNGCEHFQVKGPTVGACDFNQTDPIIGVETQLSRGRANDHPTQSRLYLKTDFEGVIVCIEPQLAYQINLCRSGGRNPKDDVSWEFYSIPVSELIAHQKYPRRINSMQKLRYSKMQRYRINDAWAKQWTELPK
ncbi:MAG: hypothetical protein NTX59_10155 [Elusimicrobia bacterium]|nr:hypothetical protein [Elusimicrobiota bacterium]